MRKKIDQDRLKQRIAAVRAEHRSADVGRRRALVFAWLFLPVCLLLSIVMPVTVPILLQDHLYNDVFYLLEEAGSGTVERLQRVPAYWLTAFAIVFAYVVGVQAVVERRLPAARERTPGLLSWAAALLLAQQLGWLLAALGAGLMGWPPLDCLLGDRQPLVALALPLVICSGSVPLRILCHRLKVPFPGLALPSVLLVASGCVALIALAISLGWEQLPGHRLAHLDGYYWFEDQSRWGIDESDAVVVHLAGTAAVGAMLVVAASAIAYWIRVRHREDETEGGT